MTEKLYDLSKNSDSKKLVNYFVKLIILQYIVKGGTHNDSWYVGGKTYLEQLNDFLDEAQAFDHKL